MPEWRMNQFPPAQGDRKRGRKFQVLDQWAERFDEAR